MLRVALLMKRAGEQTALFDAFEGRLVAGVGGRCGQVLCEYEGAGSDGHGDGREGVVRWDGSFGEEGAGIGITISEVDGTSIAQFAVPVYASDATRCEALGPALASLLLARLRTCKVWLQGDSLTVCRLLRKEVVPEDVWLFNATSITLDMLAGSSMHVSWIPRAQNCVCDELAR